MRGGRKRRNPEYAKGRRRFLLLNAAALVAAAAGGLLRCAGLSRTVPLLKGREARYYRRVGRGRKA